MNDINLLLGLDCQNRLAKKREFYWLIIIAVSSLMVFGMMHGYIHQITNKLKIKNRKLTEKITYYDRVIVEEVKKDNLSRSLHFWDNLKKDSHLMINLLKEIENIIPPYSYLTYLNCFKNTVTIEGITDSQNGALVLMKNIAKNKWMSSPSLLHCHQLQEKSHSFAIRFILQEKTKANHDKAKTL